MVHTQHQKKYGSDMQTLLGALSTGGEVAFVAALAAHSPDALTVFEKGRQMLTKPRRECLELFLIEGETFDRIADRTGYLKDDVLAHIVAGVAALAPKTEHAAEVLQTYAAPLEEDDCGPALDDFPATVGRKKSLVSVIIWLAVFMIAIAAVYHIYSSNIVRKSAPETLEIKVEKKVEPVVEKPVVQDSVSQSQGRVALVSISKEADGAFTSVPQIGREQYDEYLSNAAMPLGEESRGDVTMTFRVNRYGRPSQIRVTSMLTHEANHEAIRLIANGPEWTESARQVTITMNFQ